MKYLNLLLGMAALLTSQTGLGYQLGSDSNPRCSNAIARLWDGKPADDPPTAPSSRVIGQLELFMEESYIPKALDGWKYWDKETQKDPTVNSYLRTLRSALAPYATLEQQTAHAKEIAEVMRERFLLDFLFPAIDSPDQRVRTAAQEALSHIEDKFFFDKTRIGPARDPSDPIEVYRRARARHPKDPMYALRAIARYKYEYDAEIAVARGRVTLTEQPTTPIKAVAFVELAMRTLVNAGKTKLSGSIKGMPPLLTIEQSNELVKKIELALDYLLSDPKNEAAFSAAKIILSRAATIVQVPQGSKVRALTFYVAHPQILERAASLMLERDPETTYDWAYHLIWRQRHFYKSDDAQDTAQSRKMAEEFGRSVETRARKASSVAYLLQPKRYEGFGHLSSSWDDMSDIPEPSYYDYGPSESSGSYR